MNIINLAIAQVKREGKLAKKNVAFLVLERAYRIVKYLDIQDRNGKVNRKKYSKRATI